MHVVGLRYALVTLAVVVCAHVEYGVVVSVIPAYKLVVLFYE